jgi:hypothetical protein
MRQLHFVRVNIPALLCLAVLLAACGDDDQTPGEAALGDRYGPLAVVAGQPSGNEALISGTLKVTSDCVFLQSGSEDVVLVWPEEATDWEPDSATISYGSGRERVKLAGGDEVSFGGGGSSVQEDGLKAAEWMRSVKWVSQPASSCVTDTRWFVGDLVEHRSTVE